MMRAAVVLRIGMGGALGTGLRAAISMVALHVLAEEAYLATLLVNILGAALIGFLATRMLKPRTQALWMTGFCGGFTTFSFFSLELVILLERDVALALAYGSASLMLWMLAVWGGWWLGRNATF